MIILYHHYNIIIHCFISLEFPTKKPQRMNLSQNSLYSKQFQDIRLSSRPQSSKKILIPVVGSEKLPLIKIQLFQHDHSRGQFVDSKISKIQQYLAQNQLADTKKFKNQYPCKKKGRNLTQESYENSIPQFSRKNSCMMDRSQQSDTRRNIQSSEGSSRDFILNTKSVYTRSQITNDLRLPPIQIFDQAMESPQISDCSTFTPAKVMKTQSYRAQKSIKSPYSNTPVIRSHLNNEELMTIHYHPQSMMESLSPINQPLETGPESSTQFIDPVIDMNVSENESEEYDIYSQEPLKQDEKQDKVIRFLELLKYRYETYEEDKNDRQPISCNDILKISQQHAKRQRKTWLKWFAGKKIKWIDFRDFTQF